MNEWMNPWWWMFNSPLSGDVDQSIAPVTQWFSPQVDVTLAGNPKLESLITRRVASYGSQLGTLTDAVLELVEGKDSEPAQKLRELAAKIEEEKQHLLLKSLGDLKTALNALKQNNPEVFDQLLAEIGAEPVK
ncbi:hypothetical protein [Marinobacterium mangrovicola]|uniref:Uncharacterized protein n=1 Tax=Marinobacterium mangrovicola TaxID=1476959 RepID=A0A4R1G9B8_9GAMM|nr:hypothetical protein [Marinobacterium mangrovicola]TCK04268.1 hypothetical protein CLV83_3686 [Marinobacterium mangrovicola]